MTQYRVTSESVTYFLKVKEDQLTESVNAYIDNMTLGVTVHDDDGPKYSRIGGTWYKIEVQK